MTRFIKGLLVAVIMKLVTAYQTVSLDMVKIKGVSWYIQGVSKARLAFLAIIHVSVFVILLAAGLVLAPVSIVLLLPYALKIRLALLAALGVVYIVVPLLVLRFASSEKFWLKISGASDMLDEISRKKHS